MVDASVTATVTDSAQNTAVLVMRDDGTGGEFHSLCRKNGGLQHVLKVTIIQIL